MVLTALAPPAWPSTAEEAWGTGGWFAAITPKEPLPWGRAAGGHALGSLGVSNNQHGLCPWWPWWQRCSWGGMTPANPKQNRREKLWGFFGASWHLCNVVEVSPAQLPWATCSVTLPAFLKGCFPHSSPLFFIHFWFLRDRMALCPTVTCPHHWKCLFLQPLYPLLSIWGNCCWGAWRTCTNQISVYALV